MSQFEAVPALGCFSLLLARRLINTHQPDVKLLPVMEVDVGNGVYFSLMGHLLSNVNYTDFPFWFSKVTV